MSLCSVDSHNRSATCRRFLVCTASWYHSKFALEFCVLGRVDFRSQCCDEVCWLSFGCERIHREIFRVVFSLSQSNRLFSLVWFPAAPAVLYLSVEFVEDLIVVDHWADSTLSRVVDLTTVVVRCNSNNNGCCYLLSKTQPFVETVPSFAYLLGLSNSTRIRTLELADHRFVKSQFDAHINFKGYISSQGIEDSVSFLYSFFWVDFPSQIGLYPNP